MQPTQNPNLMMTTGGPIQPATLPPQIPPPKPSKKIWWIVGSIGAVVVLGVGVLIIWLLVSWLAHGTASKDLPHFKNARQITSAEYNQVSNANYTGLNNYSPTPVTQNEYQKLSPIEQSHEPSDTIQLTSGNNLATNKYLREEVANHYCTVTGQSVFCYNKRTDLDVLTDKMRTASEQLGLDISQGTRPILYDKVRGETYGGNADSVFRFNSTFSVADDVTPAKNPAAGYPITKDVHIKKTFCLQDNCDPSALNTVVNRHFYIYLCAQGGVSSSSKGLYIYDGTAQAWVHLTPEIDNTEPACGGHPKDPQQGVWTEGSVDYKIAQDGCSVYYKIKNATYMLDACQL